MRQRRDARLMAEHCPVSCRKCKVHGQRTSRAPIASGSPGRCRGFNRRLLHEPPFRIGLRATSSAATPPQAHDTKTGPRTAAGRQHTERILTLRQNMADFSFRRTTRTETPGAPIYRSCPRQLGIPAPLQKLFDAFRPSPFHGLQLRLHSL